MAKEKNTNWLNFLQNPKSNVIKKYMADILQHRYPPNANFLDRIASTLTTEQDMKDFAALVSSIYQAAYEKSVNDHREQLSKLGITTTIQAGN